MAQITIEYDAGNQAAKKAIDLFVSLGLFKVKELTKPKKLSGLEISLKEEKEGKVYTAKSVKDLMDKIQSNV